jgi:hypothetical protein
MDEILNIVNRMDPEHALTEVGKVVKSLFEAVPEESRSRFLLELVGGTQHDKVSSLVHL